MGQYVTEDIRNFVLIGHSGGGKTSLAEAMLHITGSSNRLGSVDDGTSIFDVDEEEKQRKYSIDPGFGHFSWKNKTLNLIDSPGFPDFSGGALPSLAGVETAVLVVSASAGLEVNTRKMFAAAGERKLARIIVVNKMDADNTDLPGLISAIQGQFGKQCLVLNLPSADGKSVVDCFDNEEGEVLFGDVSQAHTELVESIVEVDDDLMEAYLGGEEVSQSQLAGALIKSLVAGSVIPILFTSARQEFGVEALMDVLADYSPNPLQGFGGEIHGEDGSVEQISPDADGPLLAQVVRISADAKSNIRNAIVRVLSGTLRSGVNIFVDDNRRSQRSGHLLKLQGNSTAEIDDLVPGDIGAVAKLEDARTGSTVKDKAGPELIAPIKTPEPLYSLAMEPKSRGDEQKISESMSRLADEDPTFRVTRDVQTGEMVISGLGDLHLRVILARMKQRFKLDVVTKPPKIPYRETVQGVARNVEYTHKKQSGGAGQFARVFIDVEPNERSAGYEFVDKIFGGSIDQSFRPSVDKGVKSQMTKGVLAGYPVVDVKVLLVDGKTHPVDSKDIAFQVAGREAFKKAFMQAKPVLLEPIVNIEVTVPMEFVGEIARDISGKRGRIEGQDMLPGNFAVIRGQVPLSEVSQYNSQLKSATGGQGSYAIELSHYEIVPPNVQQQIVAQYKPKEESD